MPEEIDLVFSGSGTLEPCQIGARDRLEKAGKIIKRVSGSSGGALTSLGTAFGLSPQEMMKTAFRDLSGDRLLSRNWFPLHGYGLFHIEKLRDSIRKTLPGKMRDADIPWGAWVTDVETRRPIWLSSERYGHLDAAEVVAASMCIPLWFTRAKIRSIPGQFIDGGVGAGFGMSVFDDAPHRRTIGVRFKTNHRRRKVNSLTEYVRSIASILLENANNTYISKKHYQNVIEIRSTGDGMDFSQTRAQIKALYTEGWVAVDRWLKAD
jgi:predicted acylesterase/phospholipase RssA